MTQASGSTAELSERCLAEVVDLHRFFEAWLGSDEPQMEFGRCERALATGFHIVEPEGAVREREPLLAGLKAARGGRADIEDPFRIRIEEAQVRWVEGAFCLVTYVERQTGSRRRTARRSSALFRESAGGPNGVEWLHVHETWIDAGLVADDEGG